MNNSKVQIFNEPEKPKKKYRLMRKSKAKKWVFPIKETFRSEKVNKTVTDKMPERPKEENKKQHNFSTKPTVEADIDYLNHHMFFLMLICILASNSGIWCYLGSD